MRNYLHRSLLATLTLAVSIGMVSCDDDTTDPDDLSGTFFSAEKNIGDGKAKLFVTRNADGDPTEVGLRISEAALTNLPDTGMGTSIGFDMISEGSETVFKHVTLDWNPHGHPPAVFAVPHFDMHFYTMTQAELMTNINPADVDFQTKANNAPDSQYIPAGYVNPSHPDSAEAIPFMGVHWIDLATMAPPFEEVMIFGAWNGKVHFVEPMMSLEWLMTKPSREENLAQPQAWQTTGYWPTTYSVDFDDTTNEYVITLGGLTMRTAS